MFGDVPWGNGAYDELCPHIVLHAPFLSLVDVPPLPPAQAHPYLV